MEAVDYNIAHQADLIVYGGTLVTMDSEKHIYENKAVAIIDGKIADIDTVDVIKAKYSADKEIDASGKIVMPGLVNTHTHAAMSIYRGIADDLPLMDWLNNYIFPAEAKNTDAGLAYHGTKLACAEFIKSGTTTFCDMYYFENEVAQAAKEAGMRAILGETILQFPSPTVGPNGTTDDEIAYANTFIEKWKGDELITPAIAPHSPYLNTTDALIKSRDIALKHNVPYIIHVSETLDEVHQIEEREDMRPVEYLHHIGVISKDGPKIIAAHTIWLTDKEVDILAENNVGAAHNPESNMKLASGAARVNYMLENGVNVGIGTDGAASNNDLDMFGEMHTTALVHKHTSGLYKALQQILSYPSSTYEQEFKFMTNVTYNGVETDSTPFKIKNRPFESSNNIKVSGSFDMSSNSAFLFTPRIDESLYDAIISSVEDPSTAMPAKQVVEMATIGGAKVLGMDDKIGSLEEGKCADIILVDIDSLNMTPMYHDQEKFADGIYSHLVYAVHANDVDTTIINGNVVMEDRELKTLDEAAVKAKGRELAQKVMGSLQE